jgi:hypothetical protein
VKNAPTEKQLIAISVLARGKNQARASEAANVDPATVHRWMKSPAFLAALDQERTAVRAEARMVLTASVGKAVDTLLDVMENAERDRDRMDAAKLIMQLAKEQDMPTITEVFGEELADELVEAFYAMAEE